MLSSALFTPFGMPCEQILFPRLDECIVVAGGLKECGNRLVSFSSNNAFRGDERRSIHHTRTSHALIVAHAVDVQP